MPASQSSNAVSRVSPDLAAEHGLSGEEYARLLEILGREPTLTELGIFSVMWSEHCSYKSSKFWLRQLPIDGERVIQGPGENAGVVDLGDGDAAIFKMESHNHPSFIEPYQGAATGVGGIMRDVFTMGARPIANLNCLRFGAPDHAKTRHLVSGVVAGVGDYGNCVGVPTVGGEVNFDEGYNNNILVNAMCVGLAKTDRIFYAAAKGAGHSVVYVGSKTGRDGIHGATMASAEFSDDAEEKRPTVQVGDPFTEKLLIEACLELMAEDAIIAIQDMGAAGLACSCVEMADKGGVGIDLDLDAVPAREAAMSAYDMMLSESQERMLMVLKPGAEELARGIFEKWGLDFAIVGLTTDTNRLIAHHQGVTEVDVPIDVLANSAPEYKRPWTLPDPPEILDPSDVAAPTSIGDALEKMIGSPHLCSRRWVWEQYDHMVMGDTVERPGGDAAVVRIHGTNKGLAVTADVTPRYCAADPRAGGMQAVMEVWRNLTASGAEPIAITNCLNFGNPERPEIMGQFVGCIEGIVEACNALSFPVVSGNVSLYNETNGQAIPPTPAIGGVGLIPDIDRMAGIAPGGAEQALVLIGPERGHLGQSLYMQILLDARLGAPPPVDLEAERQAGELVRKLIAEQTAKAVHDVSDGGLLIALTEMALASDLGLELTPYKGPLPLHAVLFGEDQGRYVIAVEGDGQPLLARAEDAAVPARIVAHTGGDAISLSDGTALSLARIRELYEGWLPGHMNTI